MHRSNLGHKRTAREPSKWKRPPTEAAEEFALEIMLYFLDFSGHLVVSDTFFPSAQ